MSFFFEEVDREYPEYSLFCAYWQGALKKLFFAVAIHGSWAFPYFGMYDDSNLMTQAEMFAFMPKTWKCCSITIYSSLTDLKSALDEFGVYFVSYLPDKEWNDFSTYSLWADVPCCNVWTRTAGLSDVNVHSVTYNDFLDLINSKLSIEYMPIVSYINHKTLSQIDSELAPKWVKQTITPMEIGRVQPSGSNLGNLKLWYPGQFSRTRGLYMQFYDGLSYYIPSGTIISTPYASEFLNKLGILPLTTPDLINQLLVAGIVSAWNVIAYSNHAALENDNVAHTPPKFYEFTNNDTPKEVWRWAKKYVKFRAMAEGLQHFNDKRGYEDFGVAMQQYMPFMVAAAKVFGGLR